MEISYTRIALTNPMTPMMTPSTMTEMRKRYCVQIGIITKISISVFGAFAISPLQ